MKPVEPIEPANPVDPNEPVNPIGPIGPVIPDVRARITVCAVAKLVFPVPADLINETGIFQVLFPLFGY